MIPARKPFDKYIKKPSKSAVVNTKLLLLTEGLDCDFPLFRKLYPALKKEYKVNQIRVSDRHFISPKSVKRNWIPDELIIEENSARSLVKVYFRENSPLKLTIKGNRSIVIDKENGAELPVKIKLVPLYQYAKQKYKGIPLTEFLQVVGLDRISIIPFDGCEHWAFGEQCKFCGASPQRLKPAGIKPNVSEIATRFGGDYQQWWDRQKESLFDFLKKALEIFIKTARPKPHFHLSIISGNLLDLDFLWETCFETIELIKQRMDLSKVDGYFQIMPPKNLKYIDRAQKLGFKNLCFNLEAFGERAFAKVCPGKAKHYGYNKMIKALKYGVKVFGRGAVRCNFVLGSESLDELLNGISYLAGEGIVSDYSVFFPRPGSIWHKKKPLAPGQILSFSKKLASIYRKYKFKPYCCSLSSRSSIENECFNGWV